MTSSQDTGVVLKPTVLCADGIVREVHEYHCDCEWCWLGATERKPAPLSIWQRIVRALTAQNMSGPSHE